MAELPTTLQEIAVTILDVIGDCEEAKKALCADDYEDTAQSASFHWLEAVLHVVNLHPALFSLNNLLSSLTLEKHEFNQHYRDNLCDLNNACRSYPPFESLLQGEFGERLDAFLEEMFSDVDTDGGDEGEMINID